MIQRLDQLTAPVEVGKYYLVPTVLAVWNNMLDHWPIIGPQHSDAQCLNFDIQHYHPDARFLRKLKEDDVWYWRSALASPIQTNTRVNPEGLPKPIWRRRLCRRLHNSYVPTIEAQMADKPFKTWQCHFDMWTGKQAKHDGRGWVCPHRSVPLADHAAIDGVITCPLHLLRIDAVTGVVLPPVSHPSSKAVAA
jgi:hypothetical protein